MDTQRLVFDSGVEAIFVRLMGPRMDARGRARLKDAGLDLDRPLLPAYPAEDVARWIHLCLPHAYAGLTREEALRQLGRESVDSYAQSLLGKAMLAGLRMMGLRRVLAKMTRTMRAGGNFLACELRDLGPGDVELVLNDHNTLPGYYLGMFEAIVAACGVADAKVELARVTSPGGTYRVRWRE